MKKSFFITVVCMISYCSHAQESKVAVVESMQQAADTEVTIIFDKSEHDFGIVSEIGDVIEYEFAFKNAGQTPLVVYRVTTSCGCTVSDWTKEPVAPGKKGFIKITYTPKEHKGDFIKTATVYSNGNPLNINLTIKGTIK